MRGIGGKIMRRGVAAALCAALGAICLRPLPIVCAAAEEIQTVTASAQASEEPALVPTALFGALIGASAIDAAQSAETGEAAEAQTPAEDVSGNAPTSIAPGERTLARAAAKAQGTTETSKAPALPERTYTPAEEARIAAFYANTVLAGDSVLLGFRNYCRSGDEVMKGLKFLAAGSLSLHNAFWPVSSKSVHPVWQGEQRPVWESVQMIGAERVFLFFGINDMAYGVEDSVEKYGEFIAKILEYRPEARIYLISATYMLEGTEKKNLNNANIALFNQTMAGEAAANSWGFVDMATPTSDGNGNLLPAYCTDGFLHQTASAYRVWERVLKDYALEETADKDAAGAVVTGGAS